MLPAGSQRDILFDHFIMAQRNEVDTERNLRADNQK
jgi:hypothetical protein